MQGLGIGAYGLGCVVQVLGFSSDRCPGFLA